MADILLDTTFILPTLGIEVKEIREGELGLLRSAEASGTRFFCSPLSFVEILRKLGKNPARSGGEAIEEGIRSLLESGTYKWVGPTAEAVRIAFKLRLKGHKDNIDNLLYSTAATSSMFFLSLDNELKKFVEKNGFDASVIISPKDISRKIRGDKAD